MVDVVAELGHLRKLAEQDPNQRFNRLYRRLRQGGLRAIARERIAGNRGAPTPGVDGQTMKDVDNEKIVQWSEELSNGSYQPQPVRRVYIPRRNGQLRPLGIPASRDKMVQAGVALILETLDEPIVCKCSHGFRPGPSTMTALRPTGSAYPSGAKWIIEGDITDCFGNIPHRVILNCLRKRIKDEGFIDLVRTRLQAGGMESGNFSPSYSGTPPGGIASPLLANIVLHELDVWLEAQMKVNPPAPTADARKARSNPGSMKLHYHIRDIQRRLEGKRPMPKKATPEGLRRELREKLRLRSLQPGCRPRKGIDYGRYADDFLVRLCNASKQEAIQMKAAMAEWRKVNLGLSLNQDKTTMTHGWEKVCFLGYELEGRAHPNGTGWLPLGIPKEAVRNVVAKVQQATRDPQAPEDDVFHKVNAIAGGWMNYYRYAHHNNVTGGKLSMVIYWQSVHYLGKRHKGSIAKVMKDHYDRDPKTGCLGLSVHSPAKPQTPENRYFIWHKPPTRLGLGTPSAHQVQDEQPDLAMNWAKGRSLYKKAETKARANLRCEHGGATGVMLYVHHPHRLAKAKRVAKGMGPVAQSGLEQ